MTKKSGQKVKYLSPKRAFQVKQKAFIMIFKGFSVARKCLRLEIGG